MQLLLHERMSIVMSYWESLSDEQRMELLSVDLSDLRLRAAKLADKAKKHAGKIVETNYSRQGLLLCWKPSSSRRSLLLCWKPSLLLIAWQGPLLQVHAWLICRTKILFS